MSHIDPVSVIISVITDFYVSSGVYNIYVTNIDT